MIACFVTVIWGGRKYSLLVFPFQTSTGYPHTKGCARITCSVGKGIPQDNSDEELMEWMANGEGDKSANTNSENKVSAHKYVAPPAPGPPTPKQVKTDDGTFHPLHRELWLSIFSYLTPQELSACMKTCSVWNQWCQQPALWKDLDLSWVRPVRQAMLISIVKKQPIHLKLDGTNVNRQQISWLLPRLPDMKMLSLRENTAAVVHSLCSVNCPMLHYLDISCVAVLDDLLLQQLLAPPYDHRPGIDNSASRLQNLIELHISGTNITDWSLKTLSVHLPKLKVLDLSFCLKFTEAGLESLCRNGSSLQRSLTDLDLSGCYQLSKSVRKLTNPIPHVVYPDF